MPVWKGNMITSVSWFSTASSYTCRCKITSPVEHGYPLFPCTSIGYFSKIMLSSVAWVELGGTLYKCGVFVVTSSELLQQFSQIVDIVVTERSQCFFICEEYETICFCMLAIQESFMPFSRVVWLIFILSHDILF